MQDYSNGVHPEDEIVYQAWQRAHPQGLVVSLNRNRDGKYTLHSMIKFFVLDGLLR